MKRFICSAKARRAGVRWVRRSVCSTALLLVCLELRSDSFSYRTQLHSIPKLQHYLSTTPSRVRGFLEACEMMVNSGKACLASESFLGLDMTIPTEPIGSIPRTKKVITAFEQYERGSLSREEFESICSEEVRETIDKFEATGAPAITYCEQTK